MNRIGHDHVQNRSSVPCYICLVKILSINNNMGKPLDINKYRIKSDHYVECKPERVISGAFIRGPLFLSWFKRAMAAGKPAVFVGLVLWYRKGLEKRDTVRLTNVELKNWGISRQTKYRGLDQLETAGLIKINRKCKHNPVVQILIVD